MAAERVISMESMKWIRHLVERSLAPKPIILPGGAMREDGTRYYILKDHLGSASVVTNQSGTTVGEDRFYPFGETRFTNGLIES